MGLEPTTFCMATRDRQSGLDSLGLVEPHARYTNGGEPTRMRFPLGSTKANSRIP